MLSSEEATKVYSELTRLTQSDQLKWEQAMSIAGGSGESVSEAYKSQWGDQSIALVKQAYRGFDPETEEHYWTHAICLALLDFRGRITFEFPVSQGLDDLHDAITFKTSGARSFVDSLLGHAKKE